jgi:hypothetical protein
MLRTFIEEFKELYRDARRKKITIIRKTK